MLNVPETMNRLKMGEITLDELLYPGKQLYDVEVGKLPISVMQSGFPTLDNEYLFLKAQEGELIIVGGRPSMGKSAFMFQLALYISRLYPVHVFSLEMSHESIIRRLIASMTNKSISAIQRGLVNYETLETAKEELKSYNYIIDDRSGLTVQTLCDTARTRAKRSPPGLIIIDYLQLLRTEKGHSRDSEIGEITKELKGLAKDLKCPVVVGSQLNRGCETRGSQSGNYRPVLSDLRESGNIEQDSDQILCVHREYRYTRRMEDKDKAEIIFLKNRNGRIGDVSMIFDDTKTKFYDAETETI